MATAVLTFNMGWYNALPEGDFRGVISASRSVPDSEPGPFKKEFDAFHPILSALPDAAVAFAVYRGKRQDFRREACSPPGHNGVTAQITPVVDSTQYWTVMGAPHSQVRADFIAVWDERRSPYDVGKPFYVPQGTVQYIPGLSLKEQMSSLKRPILLGALEAHGWCRLKTAAALKMSRGHLHSLMRKYGLSDRRVAS